MKIKEFLALAESNISEASHQTKLMTRLAYLTGKYPEIELLYAIPNGGLRNVVVAKQLKAQGVKSGVPDLCLPVARNGYHGLYIEMKKLGGRLSPEQKKWVKALTAQGYLAITCFGCDAAYNAIIEYLVG